jgi:phospholipid transport system substrate-binding protein
MMAGRAVRVTLAVAVLAAAPGHAAEDAVALVEEFSQTLQEVLRDSAQLGYEGRVDKLAPAISGAFDLEFMSRTALGRHWEKLSEDERRQWLDAFSRMTIANYAGRFNEYTGQRFDVLGSEPASNDTVFVRTMVVVPNDEDVEVSYRLRHAGDAWKVIDVYLKGTVSELALRRSEYAAVLKRDGFAGLKKSIDEKIAALAAEGSGGRRQDAAVGAVR